jgi:ankyrin repeat protein
MALRALVMALVVFGLPVGSAAAGQVHDLARTGDLESLKRLIGTTPDLVNAKAEDGETALHEAAANNQGPVVEFLVASRAQVDARDNDGETPLRDAAKAGHTAVMQLLIAKGADVNAADNDGDTVLHTAARYGHEAAVELLIAKKAALNRTNRDGETPLDVAMAEEEPEVVALLQKHGAKRAPAAPSKPTE